MLGTRSVHQAFRIKKVNFANVRPTVALRGLCVGVRPMSAVPSRMKAVILHTPGGVEQLQYDEIEVPKAGNGQIIVANKAAGLNFIDTYHRAGLYPLPSPSTLGVEGAGVVAAIGEGVSDLKVGDRVAYVTRPPNGSYAEYTAVEADKAVQLQESISFEHGASILLQGMTAVSLATLASPVKSGDLVLVHAAAGGTGRLIVGVSRSLGATVIGTVSNEEKEEVARKAGCHHVILYTKQDVPSEVAKITGGKGVQHVFDGVGKDTFQASLNSLALGGTLVSFGNASGKVPPMDIFQLTPRNVRLMRPSLFGYLSTKEEFEALAGKTLALVASGALDIAVFKAFPLSEVAAAHETLEGRKSTGKIVLIP